LPNSFERVKPQVSAHKSADKHISISHYKRTDQGELTKLPRGGNLQRDIDQQIFFRPYYSITIPDKKSVKGKLSAI
jgi:hypothetical protein